MLFDRDGRVVLADFGLVSVFDGAPAGPRLPPSLVGPPTTTGGFAGTPAYMAPEHGFDRALKLRADGTFVLRLTRP